MGAQRDGCTGKKMNKKSDVRSALGKRTKTMININFLFWLFGKT